MTMGTEEQQRVPAGNPDGGQWAPAMGIKAFRETEGGAPVIRFQAKTANAAQNAHLHSHGFAGVTGLSNTFERRAHNDPEIREIQSVLKDAMTK